MKIHPLQGVGHIGVFLDSPVVAFQVVGDNLVVKQQVTGLPNFFMLLAVEDIGFGGLVMPVFDQHFLHQILYAFDGGDFIIIHISGRFR